MSDAEESEKPFHIEKAKTGRASCKRCKNKCENNEIRIAKMVSNAFGSGLMKQWYHIDCLLDSFKTQRATTKTIETIDDISGWETIGDLDKDLIMEKLEQLPKFNKNSGASIAAGTSNKSDKDAKWTGKNFRENSEDNKFEEFCKICDKLAKESSYLEKTATLNRFFMKGSNGKQFEGNLFLWIKMLLPTADKQIYNLQSKQLIKLFSKLFNVNQSDMAAHLERGDVSESIRVYFEKSKTIRPANKSSLTMNDVDEFLNKLSKLSKEDEQIEHFQKIAGRCTSNDLKMIIRFIKHDIRINAGPKNILAALSKDAYPSYQTSQNLKQVIQKYGDNICDVKMHPKAAKIDKNTVQLMCPISPMLAEACKSVEKAIEKCPAGIYSEIKYDGERLQLHKKGNEFKFFSRNLKPVLEHKTKRLEEFIPQAFPNADDLILDSEIIVVDTTSGELLPFGTLGKHKKTEYQTAEVCLFVFDCLLYNGEDCTKKTMQERRKILEKNMRPIKNHVQLSEYHLIKTSKELSLMIAKVLQKGLEGLVLKNVDGIYEPGKRHWLKIKKDYLFDGKMADSADLVVIGAWFGTGKKGGMLSIFLMGCFDETRNVWKTVTKVHTGLDDAAMEKLQKTLNPLMNRSDPDKRPKWLSCKNALIPDMLAIDPFKMPVFEITGAEFSKSDAHTADGISIRFPRITKQRSDKSASDATSLEELKHLFEASKDGQNLHMLTDGLDDDDIDIKTTLQGSSPKKQKHEDSPKKRKQENSPKEQEQEDDDIDMKPTLQSNNPKTRKQKDILKKPKQDDSPKISKEEDRRKKRKQGDDDIDNKTTAQGNSPKKRKQENVKSENAKKVKSEQSDRLTGKDSDGRNNEYIFKDIVLYVCDDVRALCPEELRYFKKWWGDETTNAKECTHALHKSDSTEETLQSARKKFNPRCRHMNYRWLVDSIQERKLLDIMVYPVTI
ncbi:DNA ligase 3 [Bradysia coprophila]|uniref:DNA ligase 3 n=1 Tax=Bradysia coprophila TaxID=38358 RepID=UPI00187D8222|nr:DNA ligase 3 [Bradysia coprophila]